MNKSNNSKQRGARMSKNQQEVYVTFLEQNPCFSGGIINEFYDHAAREEDYNKLVKLLNNTVGARKDKKHWQETFADWRSKLLKRYRYHYSEKARKSVTEQQIRSMKKFDNFDIRALKALGKWGDKSCLNAKPRNSGLNKNKKQSKNESEEEEEAEESLDNYDSTNDDFQNVDVKQEIEFDDQMLVEISAQSTVFASAIEENLPQPERKKIKMSDDESRNAIEENTRAIKQHTAAIMGLTDSINALTASIRSYMYNK
ncbi:hypothetical protein PVAND_014918 [Polypedilum vanderplanki]|uniref:Regulatory protein zeste n=1 Tax=Polypedilum vanderplanki TaxID=319348 RepID=A0A9J6BB49_POLVA|nr:hypothetical protein PVAND_014918 [Polypedilum vanderplanki]